MKQFTILSLSIMMLISCGTNKDSTDEKGSIFYTEFDTEYGMPPFEKITNEDFRPAFQKGIDQQSNEIDQITNNAEEPTFENTIVALDNSGQILSRVSRVFSGVKGAENNDTLQAIAEEISPILSEHSDNIYLNNKLFERINILHKDSANLELNTEQYRLLDMYYKNFVRSGIMLNDEQKDKLREINKKLSALTLSFGNNLLKETNSYTLVIDKEDDLSGLPQGIISASAEVAKDKGLDGKWVFTLHKPSWLPFLQYADNRDLREKLYKAMYNRGDNDNEFDNKKNINKIVNLRIQKANILGYDTHADFVMEERMAKTSENVYKLLNDVWEYAVPQAKKEAAELQAIIDADGGDFKLQSWDWWYYTEKLREQKYALNEEELKPYFKMENVREGVFATANKLYGLSFRKLENVPVYHPEVEAYEVTDADGSHVAIFYTDYFPRSGKNAGAWMSSFRGQEIRDGKNI
ncbi:MAG TPA: M3 family metallopeptidase, partial [Chitinophagales bacterium]|nr:M3 family metallopeptidase [Chitinophagales bacterium]